MSTQYEIPLTAQKQYFVITLAGTQYKFSLSWNDHEDAWVLNISDGSGNAILSGVPLVTGVDLLAQFAYLGFGFSLYVGTDHDTYAQPTETNLGTNSHLYAVVP